MAEDGEALDDELEDKGEEDAEAGSDDSAPPADADQPKDSKRVKDLMSKWQRAEARATAAEAKLAGDKPDAPADASADEGSGGTEFVEFMRENTRRELFKSEPLLAAAGLESAAIQGSTLAEMKASLKAQTTMVKGLEGRMRNRIQAELGLDPEVSTGAGDEKPMDFASMSDAEFKAYIDKRDGRAF